MGRSMGDRLAAHRWAWPAFTLLARWQVFLCVFFLHVSDNLIEKAFNINGRFPSARLAVSDLFPWARMAA